MSDFIEENRYSDDGNVHDKQRLKELQALPLERKVLITQTRIIEWYKHYNGQVYVSFSGGKDSTVLLHIARQLFPDIEAVYADTGLEYPEIREFVKSIDNVTWLKPEVNFRQVLDKYGYPIISKAVSRRIKDARSAIKKGNKNSYAFKMLNGTYTDKDGNLSTFNCEKWKFLIDAPFLISNYCCDVMKKKPLHKFDKETLKKPITGIMADESSQRRAHWLKTGCNAFDNKNPQSNPMSFWTENDVLEYIVKNELKICSIYGNIIQDKNGKYKTTALKRTGCMFCGYGCHLEKSPNRFERMKEAHPKIWDYCIRPKDKGGLGMGEVLDFINVPYGKEDSKEKTDKTTRK